MHRPNTLKGKVESIGICCISVWLIPIVLCSTYITYSIYVFMFLPPLVVAMIASVMLLIGATTKTRCLMCPFFTIFVPGAMLVAIVFNVYYICYFAHISNDSFVYKLELLVLVNCVIVLVFLLPSFLVGDTILKFNTELKHEQQNREHSYEQPTPTINQQSTAMMDAEMNAMNEDESPARHALCASAGAVELVEQWMLLRQATSALEGETEPLPICEPSNPEHNSGSSINYGDDPPAYEDAVPQSRCAPSALASDDNALPTYEDAVCYQSHIQQFNKNHC